MMLAAALLLALAHLWVAQSQSPTAVLPQLLLVGVIGSALTCVVLEARRHRAMQRRLWLLLAAIVLAQLGWAVFTLLNALLGDLAGWAELSSLLFLLPALYLVTNGFNSSESRYVRLLDWALVAMVPILSMILIDAWRHGGTIDGGPAIGLVIWSADAVDYSMAVLATIRLVSVASTARRKVYWAASVFLWINAVVASIYNRVEVQGLETWGQVLVDYGFVALCAAVVLPMPGFLLRYRPATRFTRVVGEFLPIATTLGVMMLGISISRVSFAGGALVSLLAAIIYGVRVALVQARLQTMRHQGNRANRRLQRTLQTDALTGVTSRSGLNQLLESLGQQQAEYSVLMIDIDNFKQFNDRYGHLAGDGCLIRVAHCVRDCLRANDNATVARYGGEEFVVVLPNIKREQAVECGRRIVAKVAAMQLPHDASSFGVVTVSVGSASHDFATQATPLQVLQAADAALYQAKGLGRNRFVDNAETLPAHALKAR